MSGRLQFWDSSAIVALVFVEPHTPAALRARDLNARYMAWEWIQVETASALRRRGAQTQDFRALDKLLSRFQYISADGSDYPAIRKLIDKHGLRAADAGHLFCLKQAQKLTADIEFVCFDVELVVAAEKEGVRVCG